MADDWQKKLRYRGFRLLAWSLPILVLSFIATSLIPRRPPIVLATGRIIEGQPSNGRFELPRGMEGPIPVLLELQWSQRPARDSTIELLIQDPEEQDRLQKKIPVKAKALPDKIWQQTMNLALPASPVQNYRLALTGTARSKAVSTQFRLTAFASMPLTKVLRFGEMLIYPALAFTLLAMSMIIFPKFMS